MSSEVSFYCYGAGLKSFTSGQWEDLTFLFDVVLVAMDRYHKKMRNNYPLFVNSQSAQQPGNTTAGLVIGHDAWNEVIEFANGDDFQF